MGTERQSIDNSGELPYGVTTEAWDAETRSDEGKQEVPFNAQVALRALKGNTKINDLVKKVFEEMKVLEDKRSALNNQMKAKRSTLEEQGIPLDSIKIAYRFYKMDFDQMQEAVIGVALCTQATGQPVQIDFLDSDNVSQIN